MIGRDYITRQLIKERKSYLFTVWTRRACRKHGRPYPVGLWDGTERRAKFRVPAQYTQRDLPEPVEIRGVPSNEEHD